MNKINKYQKGNIMLVMTLFISLTGVIVITGVMRTIIRSHQNTQNIYSARQGYSFAESGIEDVMYRLKNNMSVSTTEILTLNGNTATTTISDIGLNKKRISSLGENKNIDRNVSADIFTGVGTSFVYGVQVGEGGLSMTSATINGNVYSNGQIIGTSSSYITGSATSAGNGAEVKVLDAEAYGNTAGTIRCGNISPVAQKFTAGSTDFISKISLISGRTSAFNCNLTIKIVNDNSGIPGTTVFSSSTIPSSGISTSLASQKFNLNSYSKIVSGSSYWIVFTTDGSTSSSKYFTFRQITPTPYGPLPNGFYVNTSGTWSSSYDRAILFSLYKGGIIGTITSSSGSMWNPIHVGSSGTGNAKANTVNYTNVVGSLYCKNGTGNNKNCDTSLADPVQIPFPITDEKIDEWKQEALDGGTYNGNYSVGWAGASIGPLKINGDLTVSGGGILNLTGPLWVTGTITLNGGGKIKLDSSYGIKDGMVISDGEISISGGGNATGSGTAGSYLMMITTSPSSNAVSLNGGAGAVVLFAPNGTINISGGASVKEATGYAVSIGGGATLTYESGLADMDFTTGPSGSWEISSWKESE